jgi:hypothetical protein
MKTTVEISDSLLQEAEALASRNQTSLSALVERALRLVVPQRQERSGFRLRRATFNGQGLQPGIREGSWEQLRDKAYEGRGS